MHQIKFEKLPYDVQKSWLDPHSGTSHSLTTLKVKYTKKTLALTKPKL